MEKNVGLLLIFLCVYFLSCKTIKKDEPKYLGLNYNIIDLVKAISYDTLHLGEIINQSDNNILIHTRNITDTFSIVKNKSIFLNSKLIHSFDTLNIVIKSQVTEFPIVGNKSEFLDKYELKLDNHKFTLYKTFVSFDDLNKDGLIQAYLSFEDIIFPLPIIMIDPKSALYYELNINPFEISERQYDLFKIKLLSDVKFTELYNYIPPRKFIK